MAITYKPSQIYQIVNSVVNQAIGGTSLTVVDTSSLVSMGDEVLATNTNKEAFFNTLADRIGKVVCDVDHYVSKKRSIYKNVIDFGNAIQMITYEFGTSSVDRGWAGVNSWDSGTRQSQSSPYDNAPNETATQYIFKDFCAWEYDTVIPDFQLRTAFTNADAMATFISGLYIVKANKLALDVEALGNVAVGRAMLECYKEATKNGGNKSLFANVLADYNKNYLGLECTVSDGAVVYPTGWVMADDALADAGFLRYLSMFMTQRVKQFKDYTKAFNIAKHTTFCNDPAIEVNTFVANACQYNMEADTYHNELVALPNYNEISYWMASDDGTTSYDFNATSKVWIQDNSTASNHRYKFEKVIGFIYDPKAVMVTVEDYRSHALYNPKDEVTNTYDKSNIKFAVVPYRDMCVLQIADPVVSGGAVDYLLNGVATKS